MFFEKKKKQELGDQQGASFQERKAPRWGKPQFNLLAGISINGYDGEGQLGNISISGCSLLSVTYVNIKPDEVYQVKITPPPEDKLEPFSLNLKLSWTKSSETLFYAGFSLEKGNSNHNLSHYVEVLRSRGALPDYGNMGSP